MSGLGRIPRLELGALHPEGRCAFCGASASTATLKRTTLALTYAIAPVCEDACGCERRRYRIRHGITENATGWWAS